MLFVLVFIGIVEIRGLLHRQKGLTCILHMSMGQKRKLLETTVLVSFSFYQQGFLAPKYRFKRWQVKSAMEIS